MVAVVEVLLRPVGVDVDVARLSLARHDVTFDVVLNRRDEESGSVSRCRLASENIPAAYPKSVVVRAAADVVAGVELGVNAEVDHVLRIGVELLANVVQRLGAADRQRRFQSLPASVVVSRLGRNTQVGLHSGSAPLAARRQLGRVGVALEVVS